MYLFFFLLGMLTTIALTLVINPALMQGFLKQLIQTLFDMLAWLTVHPLAMLCVVIVLILLIIGWSRDRGR